MLAAGPLLRPYVYTYIEHCAASGGILASRLSPAACVLLAAAACAVTRCWRSASASASAWQPTGNSSKLMNPAAPSSSLSRVPSSSLVSLPAGMQLEPRSEQQGLLLLGGFCMLPGCGDAVIDRSNPVFFLLIHHHALLHSFNNHALSICHLFDYIYTSIGARMQAVDGAQPQPQEPLGQDTHDANATGHGW